VPIDAGTAIEKAMRSILAECSDQITENMRVVLDSADPEGPHQLRIGLRRLRAALQVFRPILKRRLLHRIDRGARWLGRKVGKLRNLDVVTAELLPRVQQEQPRETGLKRLVGVIERQKSNVRNELRAGFGKGEALDLRRDLAQCLLRDLRHSVVRRRRQNARADVAALFEEAISAQWAQIHAHYRKIRRMSETERHDMRKRLKNIRYSVEFAAPLLQARSTERFLARLKKLQSIFGDLNDAAMARAVLREKTPRGAKSSPVSVAAELVIARTEIRAKSRLSSASTLWRKLESARLPRRL